MIARTLYERVRAFFEEHATTLPPRLQERSYAHPTASEPHQPIDYYAKYKQLQEQSYPKKE